MFKVRNLATLLALSSVAVLPACSMFGGGDHGSGSQAGAASYPSQSYASAQQTPPPPEATPMSQDTIRQVQQNLQQAGMYRARVDGVWGPATEAAVRSFQQQHNLNATGQLDTDTLSAMNLNNNNQNYGSNNNPPTNDQSANGQPNNYNPPNNVAQSNNPNQPNTNTTR